ncbi:membrane protein [Ectopseudomonas mendocina]|uniref:Membrane protein n=1 Tax=Ectopseudomonas mendocina TaxID=300 RepID=A0A379IV40_ECTME|nr:YetF domain-containing protein [Pseudomonas mendocina]SUD40168.1 membrane protein [Pseudomonas mendocina]
MDAVLRAGAVYLALLILFKLSGRRSLAQLTTFDFVLLLIIGEATQQALLGEDFSVTNMVQVVATLIVLDVGASLLKRRNDRLARLLDGSPTIIVEDGVLMQWRMDKARLTLDDVMESARESGLERLEQIRYAIVERNGKISIIQRSAEK